MDISSCKQQDIITKIRKSKTFSKAPTSNSLLQYLCDASINNVVLKESIIDIEFFKNEGNTDKSSPRVRVNIYNLRKKLTEYYQEEGKADDIIVSISKGQYNIQYLKRPALVSISSRFKRREVLPYLLLLGVCFAFALSKIPPKKDGIWQPFVDESSTLYIGDIFGVMGYTATGNYGWNRDYSINNLREYYQYCEQNPSAKANTKPANYTYTTGMAVTATQEIEKLFQQYKKSPTVKLISQTSIADIKQGNAIYVGPTKNENHFIHFFNLSNPYFNLRNNILELEGHPSLADTSFTLNADGLTEEYAIVSKIPGPNNTHQLLFFSNHDIGVSSTITYFTAKDNLQKFIDGYLDETPYFTAVFKATGMSRTNTKLDLILLVPIHI